MEKIYSPKDEAELAVLRSLLDSRGIPHFVHNDAFGTILPGPHIDNYNVKSIMVPEAAAADARASIADYLQVAEKPAHARRYGTACACSPKSGSFSGSCLGVTRRGQRRSDDR